MSAYLSIESVCVSYAATPVLDKVSLDVQRGEMVALLGSSGCGKTTLLRAIAGFVTPRSGRIVVDGRDITHLPPEARQTAMMFQSYALWPHMNVAANIGYGLRMRGVAKAAIAQRVEQMLELLQLPGFGARNVTALSGGQRQRVALGRALAVDPLLLLLDEPMSSARPSATRWRWPPESAPTARVPKPSSCKSFSMSATRVAICAFGTPRMRRP